MRQGVRTLRNDDPTYSRNELRHCPNCRHNGFNLLADGRYQCKRCRKKFTPRQRKSRLPAPVIHDIANSFWQMVPAVSSSSRLGLNRKTIQRYYLILRLRILRERERALREQFGEISLDSAHFDRFFAGGPGNSGHDRAPVFGIVRRGGEAWVLLPGKTGDNGRIPDGEKRIAPDCWVYARDLGAYEAKDIDRFLCISAIDRERQGSCPFHGNNREDFWLFAKHRLKKYYGGFKRNFPLFIREMEFRFNHRDDADAVVYLLELLANGPY
jgi:transposase